MLNIIKVLILCLVSNSFLFARSYTLEELLSETFRHSKQLRAIEKKMEQANERVSGAWGKALPNLRSSITVSHAFRQLNPFYPMRIEDENLGEIMDLYNDMDDISTSFRNFGPTLTYTTIDYLMHELDNLPKDKTAFSVSVYQPIFAQGKIWAEVQIEKTLQRINVCHYNDIKMKVKADVIKNYLGSLLAQKNVEIQKKAVELSEETHRLAVVRYTIGKASELDTLVSRLNLENAKIEVEKAQSAKLLTYEALIMQAGIIEIADSFSVSGEFPQVAFKTPLELVLGKVRRGNYKINQLKGEENLKKTMVEMAKTDFYPNIFLGASLSKIGSFDGIKRFTSTTWDNDINVFAGLTWDLFTGMTRNYRLRDAYAEKDRFKFIKNQQIDEIEFQTRKAYEKVVLNRDRIDAIMMVINLSEKRYSLAKKEYENGCKTLLDVQNAEFELNKSEIKYNIAQYDFHSSMVDLYLLMGDIEEY